MQIERGQCYTFSEYVYAQKNHNWTRVANSCFMQFHTMRGNREMRNELQTGRREVMVNALMLVITHYVSMPSVWCGVSTKQTKELSKYTGNTEVKR